MKKVIVIILLLSVVWCFAREEKNEPSSIGFGAGELSRNGVIYRYWHGIWGIQLTGMLLANDDGIPGYYDYREGEYPEYTYYGYGRDMKSNFGIQIMKEIKSNNLSKFYAFAGYGLYHKEQKLWVSEYPDMYFAWNEGYKVKNTHYYGAGVGVDFNFLDYFRGYIEIPITFKSNGEINMYIPQAGLMYKF